MNLLNHERVQAICARHAELLDGSDLEFMERVYGGDLARYADRIVQYGFNGLGRVLDAGAGVGQWSLALCTNNPSTTALEISPQRFSFLSNVARDLQLTRLRVLEGSVGEMPFTNEEFDGVFCYGVLEQTAWRNVVVELTRVLRADGLLYINANGPGWYRFLEETQHNRSDHYDPRASAAQAFANAEKYRRGEQLKFPTSIVIEPDELEAELMGLGFNEILRAGEGQLAVHGYSGPRVPPFFLGDYKGEACVYEMLARKAT